MNEYGTIAITSRADGNRWYGRISIPESIAKSAGILEGMKISAKCIEGLIEIRLDEQGRIKFPAAKGKNIQRHAFEAATTTLGLREIPLSQCATEIIVENNIIKIKVPNDCLSNDIRSNKKNKKEVLKSDYEILKPHVSLQKNLLGKGSAAAIVTEANRVGKSVQPMNINQILNILKEKKYKVEQIGARLFSIDGKNISLPDLMDMAYKLTESNEQNKIILITN